MTETLHPLILITGASGSGKTTLLKYMEDMDTEGVFFKYFDDIGIPSIEEMNHSSGSTLQWQKNAIHFWIESIKKELKYHPVIFEGQMRLKYIQQVCERFSINNFKIVLLDCDWKIRCKRLADRGHAHLTTQDIKDCADLYRSEAENISSIIIDSSEGNIEKTADILKQILKEIQL